jgi:hypothetical protein
MIAVKAIICAINCTINCFLLDFRLPTQFRILHTVAASSIIGAKHFAGEPVAAESKFEGARRAPFQRAWGGNIFDRSNL